MPRLEDAVELCTLIESIAPEFNCHVALTGGCLFAEGERRDIDLVIYRIRQAHYIDWNGFKDASVSIGLIFTVGEDYGWCKKAMWRNFPIDVFDPEDPTGPDDPHSRG